MKVLYFLTCLLLLSSCGPIMSPEETSLVGDWQVPLQETYYNNVLFSTTPQSDFTVCHLNLTNTPETGMWRSVVGLDCNPHASQWKIETPGVLQVSPGWILNIEYHTADSLVLRYQSTATMKIMYYLRR